MAALTTQKIVDAGTAPTLVAAGASGDTAEVGNGLNTFLRVRNAHATLTRTVTITVPGNTSYGQPTPDPQHVVAAASGEKWIPMRKAYDAGDGTGRASITYSDSGADLTVAVVQLG